MTAHCLPGPDQLAALGAVLCLYRGPAGSELTGWSQVRAVRCESRLDSDGLCEALCFIDQDGRPCWKLYLLPDTDFLAWDWLGVGMSAECCEEAGIAERLWRRLSRHLLGPQWRANVLRFHVIHEVRGDAVVSRLLASQPPCLPVARKVRGGSSAAKGWSAKPCLTLVAAVMVPMPGNPSGDVHGYRRPGGWARAAVRSYTRCKPDRRPSMGPMLALILMLAGIILLFKTVRIVPQGYEWTVEKFGRYTHTMTPGLHFLMPVMYSVGRKINMMEQVMDVPSQDVITKDNAVVKVDGVVYFQVLDAAKAAYEVAQLEIAILNLVMTNIRTAIGSMDLDESLSKRDEINTKVLHAVDEATHPWGIKVNRIELKDIQPPRDLVDSMARQMKAEREKRANILEAEGLRQAQILRAEGEKQSAILSAEGQREAAFREAEARERLAEAEAKATEMVSNAISAGNVQAINYFVAQKYIEACKSLAEAPNQKFVMMPMESAGIIGSLAGIAELAKESLERGRAPALKQEG